MARKKNDGAHVTPRSLRLSRRALLRVASATVLAFALPSVPRAKLPSLRVVYYDDYAPYSFISSTGHVTGIYADCVREILGRRCGIWLTHDAMPWARAQQEAKDGRADVYVTSPTEARREYMHFSQEAIMQLNRVIVFAKDNPKAEKIKKITSVEDLKEFSVATYYGDSRLNTLFKDIKVDITPDTKRAYMKIASGRIDLTVSDSAIWKYQMRSLDIRDKLDSIWLSAAPATHLAIRKSHADAVDILKAFDNATAAARADGTIDRIIASYA
jgi:polar amino acid transport system substrate-binding protein